MLKCRHLRVRVRAPRATMMRRRELALLPVLPLIVDPVHLLVEIQVLQGGRDKEDKKEEAEEEAEEEGKGQGDNEEKEEDEQPPLPLENIRKKDSRKKSKRGRKSPF
jgi:hypothetical protein